MLKEEFMICLKSPIQIYDRMEYICDATKIYCGEACRVNFDLENSRVMIHGKPLFLDEKNSSEFVQSGKSMQIHISTRNVLCIQKFDYEN